MLNILNDLNYNIVDDGYLCIYRVEIADDARDVTTCHFLSTGEMADKDNMAELYRFSFQHKFINSSVLSSSRKEFKDLDEFRKFIDILCKKESYNKHGFFVNSKEMDELLFNPFNKE